jgi:acyl carrier protein phosphodiesterase
MNLLAHAYLSFGQLDILVGNMISDFVKGKKKFDYSVGIQKGIALHRAIDDFTDSHAVTRQAKEFFRADYRLYAGAFVDVVYDHFLANDTVQFKDESLLQAFAQSTYNSLEAYKKSLPEKFGQMLPYMQAQNWLYNYRKKEGIEKSFHGLVRRSAYLTESAIAFRIFNSQYQPLEKCYQQFFPELKKFAAAQLRGLNNS